MKWLLNENAGIIKKTKKKTKKNNYPITDSMTIDDSTYINFNHCHSHMFIYEMIAIKLISVNMHLKVLTMMYDMPMAWIENEIIGIIFIPISITISCIFNWGISYPRGRY